MRVRLTRSEQAELVRTEVLAAAKAEFLEHGYHGTTVDRIAAAAGFTKGAVYSRFDSKADLFLALLEDRIVVRAAQNEALAESLSGTAGFAELLQRWSEIEQQNTAWTMLVIEFRAHATREPELGRRYAELHRRTLAGVGTVVESVLGQGADPGVAQMVLALAAGSTLERAVDPAAVSARHINAFVAALVTTDQGGTT